MQSFCYGAAMGLILSLVLPWIGVSDGATIALCVLAGLVYGLRPRRVP